VRAEPTGRLVRAVEGFTGLRTFPVVLSAMLSNESLPCAHGQTAPGPTNRPLNTDWTMVRRDGEHVFSAAARGPFKCPGWTAHPDTRRDLAERPHLLQSRESRAGCTRLGRGAISQL
jgi:hypothetical protein